jgi:dephospho-CoA kinase
MTAKQRIYLIGLPASGKTTIGRWLAERLGWEFYDIDEAVISKSGLSIFRFFEERGEEEFRKLETELLEKAKTISIERLNVLTKPYLFKNLNPKIELAVILGCVFGGLFWALLPGLFY